MAKTTCIHLDTDGLPEGACRRYEEELVACHDDCDFAERLPFPTYAILEKVPMEESDG